MTKQNYKKQVELLLAVLPEAAKETCFAMFGGTAINLFIREMPRLSVDIDLTYLPIEDRPTTLNNIAQALQRIKTRVEQIIPNVRVLHKQNIGKLLISSQGVDVKLEVNLVGRGTLVPPEKMTLCQKAQDEFDSFCTMQIVPLGQLYGGKICAALDRQHPRDLFDIKYLLKNEGFSDDVKRGFLYCLLSGDRPIHEVISPNYLDQRRTIENQFTGMSHQSFSYDEYVSIREKLVKIIHQRLTKQDKEFLLNIKNLTPDWSLYDFEKFPAIQWKLLNLKKLKDTNPKKHQQQYEALKDNLSA